MMIVPHLYHIILIVFNHDVGIMITTYVPHGPSFAYNVHFD
jgi:hypothetical protein